MIVKLISRTVLWFAVMGVLLFAGAGTPSWPAGWAFLALMMACSLVFGLLLGAHDPELLKERLAPPIQEGQSLTDKVLLMILITGIMGTLVLAGLDAVRFGWSDMPASLQWVGAVFVLVSVASGYWVMRENSFAAPVVKIQKERGQRVISTGPYGYVRHPMYAGALFYLIGVPLMLGSWWGLALAPLLAFVLGLRIIAEEETLRGALAGYDDYAARVRYRLIPLVW
jgi:protein-S-isoprenylcysteine O-methyltransferase Ste14